ncbi:hypothetical protein L198_00271 [Cryptococcus wingfieldii CBS 7118]|uniref:FHA domain-containing protein n=1 Tax=Cryptococcus wingfieldii CBS 7118 TaxID=1295528 RepID=A0A1E3K648_9TREE|nr:hypothetical protein L198_00271 [Cryptococcus wingfieldii CBS 7118]ODO08541.1 hypothetical protein L198_00271 [Cryptococcus wingfieldii CBS 7118]
MQQNYQHPNDSHGSGPNAQAGGGPGGGQPQGGEQWGGPFPSLHLWPLQDTFQMKMIHLPEGQRIKIGRQTNNKTVPGERNAYFDSKVLSRLHAEIFEQGGKVFIRDIRSSNGTFINGERLSPEGIESEPVEVKSEDQIEFGIDIVSDDNRTIVHHRVAAKAYCVFNDEDASKSAREFANYQTHDPRVRRLPEMHHHPSSNPLSHMGPTSMSGGGKPGAQSNTNGSGSGLSFEHVLNKLQAELEASKEMSGELQGLAGAFGGIQETLSGGVAPKENGSAEKFIPPQYRSPSADPNAPAPAANGDNLSAAAQSLLAGPHGSEAAAFLSLQSQLSSTQSSISTQLTKIQELEAQLKEHETLRGEVERMRGEMEERRREMDMLIAGGGARGRTMYRGGRDEEDDDDDDDDARSVATIMDDEESERRVRERRRAERDRPRTPEPTGEDDESDAVEEQTESAPAPTATLEQGALTIREKEMLEQNNALVSQLNTLSTSMTEALTLSHNLQSQHAETISTIQALSARISSLESSLEEKVREEVGRSEEKWEGWRVRIEEGWKKEREGWERERERLRGVVREWEEASRRAHEEEEERRENELLSDDGEYVDDEDIEEDDELDDEEDKELWDRSEKINLSPSRKPAARRRRPSHKTLLAVSALKAVADGVNGSTLDAGALTPTSGEATARPNPRSLKNRRLHEIGRNSSSQTVKGGKSRSSGSSSDPSKPRYERGDGGDDQDGSKESTSESGRESGDTLKEGEREVGKKRDLKNGVHGSILQPQQAILVLVVAVAVGAIWYKHKE